VSYQVLARKWRPANFTQVVGQEHVVKSLLNALRHDRLHHAYLFTGTRGVGKTTLARILAKAINCEQPTDSFNPCGACPVCRELDEGRFVDLIEVDAASRTKVEDTRDLLDNAQYAPHSARYKVYLIDEVHMLSGHSFNALLKTLEEPPPHVKFLLATTDPQKIPVTVLSRCLQFNLKRLLPGQIFEQMQSILKQEQIEADDSALKLLARAADGSMRDGLSLLDQAIVYGGGKVSAEDIQAMLGIVAQKPVEQLLAALNAGDANAILDTISVIADLQPDFGSVLDQLIQILHRIALAQLIPGLSDPEFDGEMIAAFAKKITPADVQLFYQIALHGQKDLELAPDSRMGFEMVMLRMLAFKPVVTQVNQPDHPLIAAAENGAQPPISAENPKVQRAPSHDAVLDNVNEASNQNPDDWAEMIGKMGLESITRELANNCVIESIDGQSCKLQLSAAYKHLLSPGRQQKLQNALQDLTGKPIKLAIEVVTSKIETPSLQMAKTEEARQRAAVEAINSDANIQALKEHFDARILPGTIEPV
jgi:DNA polymerase III subunit gamma/tau